MTPGRLLAKAREEVQAFHLRLRLAEIMLSPLPPFVGSRLRAHALRMAGFRIGEGTMFWGMPEIRGASPNIREHLTIGKECWFNAECHLDVGGEIRIGDGVSCGPQVMILTSTHELDGMMPQRRAGVVAFKPVVVEDGVWLGARSTILPGVTVGRAALVAAGAVVHQDVPRNTMVAGVPARVVKEFPER